MRKVELQWLPGAALLATTLVVTLVIVTPILVIKKMIERR